MTAEHIVAGFDEELNHLTSTLAQLGGVVESMVTDAMEALNRADTACAQEVIARDKKANELQIAADQEALRIFALRHPMAGDLRRVMGAVRVASDLERIGDLAEGIARRVLDMNIGSDTVLTKSVYRMGKLVKCQVSAALDALLKEDKAQACKVWLTDKDVDEMYHALFRELLTYMFEDSGKISMATSLLFVAKNLERIGDHATNLAEAAFFTVTGERLNAQMAHDMPAS